MTLGGERRIRKIAPAPRADFDDQAWLINCALLILAGSIAGVVAAVSDFDDPRLLYNGYVRLAGVGVIVLALFAAMRWLEGRVLRRVQFCILVSLLVHFWIDVYLISSYLEAKAEIENRRNEIMEDPAEAVTLPDYLLSDSRTSEIQSVYDEPTRTPVPPKPENEPAIDRTAERDLPFEPRRPTQDQTPTVSQPNPAELKRRDVTAPRRDIAAGGPLSRQLRPMHEQVGQPIPQPPPTPPQPDVRPELQSSDIALSKQTIAAENTRPVATSDAAATSASIKPAEAVVRRHERAVSEPPRVAVTQSSRRPSQAPSPAAIEESPSLPVMTKLESPAARPEPNELASPSRQLPAAPPAPASSSPAGFNQVRKADAEAVSLALPARRPADPKVEPTIGDISQVRRATVAPASIESRPVEVEPHVVAAQQRMSPATIAQPQVADLARTSRAAVDGAFTPRAEVDTTSLDTPTQASPARRQVNLHTPAADDRPVASASPSRQPSAAKIAATTAAIELPSMPSVGGAVAATLDPQPQTISVAKAGADSNVTTETKMPTSTADNTSLLATGAAEVPTRQGVARARGNDSPSVAAVGSQERPSRQIALPAVGIHAEAELVPGAAASALTAVGRDQARGVLSPSAGAVEVQRSNPNVSPAAVAVSGTGPNEHVGTAQPVGIAQLARVARFEAKPAESGGGPTVRSIKKTSTAVEIPAAGELSDAAPQTASSGGTSRLGSPLEPASGGIAQRVYGLAGALERPAAAGDFFESATVGSPIPSAPRARRVETAATDAQGSTTSIPATIARRTTGIELPSIVPMPESEERIGSSGGESRASASVSVEPSLAVVGKTATASASATEPHQVGTEVGSATAGVVSVRLPARNADTRESNLYVGRGGSAARRTASSPMIETAVVDGSASTASGSSTKTRAGDSRAETEQGIGLAPSELKVVRIRSEGDLGSGTTFSGVVSMSVEAALEAVAPVAPAAARPVAPGGESSGNENVAARMPQMPRELSPVSLDRIGDLSVEGELPRKTAGIAETASSSLSTTTYGQIAIGKRALPPIADSAAVSSADAGSEIGIAASHGATVGRRPELASPVESLNGRIAQPVRTMSSPEITQAVAEEGEHVSLTSASDPSPVEGRIVAPSAALGEDRRLVSPVGGVAVEIPINNDIGGLGESISSAVGMPSRRARPESQVVHTVARRFVAERTSGLKLLDGTIREPLEAYRRRDLEQRGRAAQARGGSEGTERAVEMGLDFLARMQFADGRWSLHRLPPGVVGPEPALGQMESDSAATAMALLAYFGAGYTHLDDKHRDTVRRGLQWLVQSQKADGDLFSGGTTYAWFYTHGMATMALCEAYGMTQDPELRAPAERAVRFILASQHPQRGGWRYAPQAESDTSVSGWQLQALKSAQIAGIAVPDDALKKIDYWLDLAHVGEGRYVYNPFADRSRPEQAQGLRPSMAMTAEAMLMRMYLGRQRGEPLLMKGADWLVENLPQWGDPKQPARDCYYWYYATQVMFHLQGDYWIRWNERMRAVLEPTQETIGPWAGSWHPDKPVRDRWGHAGGRLYVTCMHLLMLEVYYRVLPLYQELVK